ARGGDREGREEARAAETRGEGLRQRLPKAPQGTAGIASVGSLEPARRFKTAGASGVRAARADQQTLNRNLEAKRGSGLKSTRAKRGRSDAATASRRSRRTAVGGRLFRDPA